MNRPIRRSFSQKRTYLANERTFLSYCRTALLSLSVGLGLIKLDRIRGIDWISVTLIVLSGVLLALGIWRFFATRKSIDTMDESKSEKESDSPNA